MKKKILFLIHTLGGGGAEKVLANLVNNMDKNLYDVTLMTVIDTGVFKKDVSQDVTYKTMVPLPSKNGRINDSGSLLKKKSKLSGKLIKIYTAFWRYMPIKWVYRIFIKEKYDIEVAFLEGICAKIIANSTNKNSKKISWIHVDLENQHKSGKIFKSLKEEEQIYNKFDDIVCVSQYVKTQFQKMFTVHGNIVVRYNPVDVQEIIQKSSKPMDEKNLRRKFTVCSVGRLNAQKSYIRLLECHKRLMEEGNDYDLWIIGEGTDRENLAAYIEKNNLNDSVKLLGFKINPYCYMKNADLFVCSSIAEGFSTVATEALVLGLPVVTTDCSGMQELLGDSEYGIITENSVDGLYEGMKRILQDQELYAEYKVKAQMRTQIFDMENSINEIQCLF